MVNNTLDNDEQLQPRSPMVLTQNSPLQWFSNFLQQVIAPPHPTLKGKSQHYLQFFKGFFFSSFLFFLSSFNLNTRVRYLANRRQRCRCKKNIPGHQITNGQEILYLKFIPDVNYHPICISMTAMVRSTLAGRLRVINRPFSKQRLRLWIRLQAPSSRLKPWTRTQSTGKLSKQPRGQASLSRIQSQSRGFEKGL